jgi:hypothetical protein
MAPSPADGGLTMLAWPTFSLPILSRPGQDFQSLATGISAPLTARTSKKKNFPKKDAGRRQKFPIIKGEGGRMVVSREE